MKKIIIIYTTTKNKKEAKKIAKILIEKKLAACCNIFKIYSLFSWQGKIEETNEWAIFIKTKRNLFKKIEKTIKRYHSYSLPCIVSFAIEDGFKKFLKWIFDSTNS